jgi:hypothetical protein
VTPGADPDPATIAYLAALYELERDPEHDQAALFVGPYSAFVMIGALQLATRHPEMSPTHRRFLAEIIDQLRPLFAGTPGEALIRLGDDPAHDAKARHN